MKSKIKPQSKGSTSTSSAFRASFFSGHEDFIFGAFLFKGRYEMKRQYDFYEDAGHGWLEVTLKDLMELKVGLQISNYSYVSAKAGSTKVLVYIEEDCDAGIYLKAYKNKYRVEPKINRIYKENIFIRDLPSYDASVKELKELQELFNNL